MYTVATSFLVEAMEVLLSHDRFFTRLVNLIPTDLYNHTESMTGNKNSHAPEVVENSVIKANDGEEGNSKYFKHKKQPLAADEKKLLRQERKKRKYEPDQDEVHRHCRHLSAWNTSVTVSPCDCRLKKIFCLPIKPARRMVTMRRTRK